MRRAKLVLLLPVVPLLALLAPAAAQAAATGSQVTAAAGQATTTYTCYPNTSAAFNITVSNVVDKQTTTTLSDGYPVALWRRATRPTTPT
jgi:hypothetical protein